MINPFEVEPLTFVIAFVGVPGALLVGLALADIAVGAWRWFNRP